MAGWIKIHREIADHWIWQDPVKLKWWLTLIIEVNYSEGKVILGNTLYIIKPGQSANSLRTWAFILGAGIKAITNFFDVLEKEGMIDRSTIGKGKQSTTLINIRNFDKYQSLEESLPKRKRNASATQAQREGHTIKEGEEGKEGNNNINIPDFENFLNVALEKEKDLDPSAVKLKYDAWIENDWKNGNGLPIKNWKSALYNTIPYIKKKEKNSAQKEKDQPLFGRMTEQDIKDSMKGW